MNFMLKNSVILSGGVVAAVALIFGACATEQNELGIPVPSAKMARDSGKPLDTLGKGYSLFQLHCAQCHELKVTEKLKMPDNTHMEQWHAIVPGMAWDVGLKKGDEEAVIVYIEAAIRQIEQSE